MSLNAFKRVHPGSWLALGALAGGLALPSTLRLNLTRSLPLGFYRVIGGPVRRHDLVIACPPLSAARLARARGYLAPGSCPGGVEPLGKRVLATAGDLVTVTAAGVFVNRAWQPCSRSSPADTAARPLPHFTSTRRLEPGELWLSAAHPRSFDSRYFGSVAGAAVRDRIAPLWTWSAAWQGPRCSDRGSP